MKGVIQVLCKFCGGKSKPICKAERVFCRICGKTLLFIRGKEKKK